MVGAVSLSLFIHGRVELPVLFRLTASSCGQLGQVEGLRHRRRGGRGRSGAPPGGDGDGCESPWVCLGECDSFSGRDVTNLSLQVRLWVLKLLAGLRRVGGVEALLLVDVSEGGERLRLLTVSQDSEAGRCAALCVCAALTLEETNRSQFHFSIKIQKLPAQQISRTV